jgi:hypothetical protein
MTWQIYPEKGARSSAPFGTMKSGITAKQTQHKNQGDRGQPLPARQHAGVAQSTVSRSGHGLRTGIGTHRWTGTKKDQPVAGIGRGHKKHTRKKRRRGLAYPWDTMSDAVRIDEGAPGPDDPRLGARCSFLRCSAIPSPGSEHRDAGRPRGTVIGCSRARNQSEGGIAVLVRSENRGRAGVIRQPPAGKPSRTKLRGAVKMYYHFVS